MFYYSYSKINIVICISFNQSLIIWIKCKNDLYTFESRIFPFDLSFLLLVVVISLFNRLCYVDYIVFKISTRTNKQNIYQFIKPIYWSCIKDEIIPTGTSTLLLLTINFVHFHEIWRLFSGIWSNNQIKLKSCHD